jgi:glycerol-3-phosphate acyltransferase PlsY
VLGLVRGLVEWVPTSADWAGYVAGPLVLLGYAVGSIPFDDALATRRFRRQLATGSMPAPPATDLDPGHVLAQLLAGAGRLLVATVAWDVAQEAAPRGAIGAVGTYSNQALGAWVSIAIWTGAAAVVGSMAPVFTRFRRGGSGVAPALALLVAYTPVLAATGLAVGAVAWGLGARWRLVLGIALAAVVAVEYLLWITDTQLGWGVTNGPEIGLWTAVLAVFLLGRSAMETTTGA